RVVAARPARARVVRRIRRVRPVRRGGAPGGTVVALRGVTARVGGLVVIVGGTAGGVVAVVFARVIAGLFLRSRITVAVLWRGSASEHEAEGAVHRPSGGFELDHGCFVPDLEKKKRRRRTTASLSGLGRGPSLP